MKKTFIISSLICILTLSLFTACGSSNPSYWEAWKSVDGYMILDSEGATTRHFEPYSPNITDKSHEAKMYTHSYSREPYLSFTVQEWDSVNIEYKDVTTNRFTISNKPKELNGFLFYKDDETIYIVNTLFNNDEMNLKLRLHENNYTSADYRFIIDVDGIYDDIEILMDKKSTWQ